MRDALKALLFRVEAGENIMGQMFCEICGEQASTAEKIVHRENEVCAQARAALARLEENTDD